MYNGRPAQHRVAIQNFESPERREPKGFLAVVLFVCGTLFNKIQVTCVGARVSEFAINESDHALINVIGSKERLSARSI